MTKQKPKRDVYQEITDRVIAALERGVNPWRKPWTSTGSAAASGMPHNAVTGRPYRGINVALLMIETMEKGYQSTGWITPKRAMEAGLNFKGQKTTEAVFWKKLRVKDRDAEPIEDGEPPEREILMAKTYRVLNLDQCEGDKSKLKGCRAPADLSEKSGSELADLLSEGLGVTIRHQGDQAFYAPHFDQIVVPPVEVFTSDAGYRGTLLHEATHAAGAAHRLERDLKGRFGSESYAAEELVAELGATYLQALLGIEGDLEHHASYADSWLKVLQGDKKAIFTAASKAQAAADYIAGVCNLGQTEAEPETCMQEAA